MGIGPIGHAPTSSFYHYVPVFFHDIDCHFAGMPHFWTHLRLPPACVWQSNSFSKPSLKRVEITPCCDEVTWLLQLRYRVLQLCQHQGPICAGFVGTFGKQKLTDHDTAKSTLRAGCMWGRNMSMVDTRTIKYCNMAVLQPATDSVPTVFFQIWGG